MQMVECKSNDTEPKETIDLLSDSENDDVSSDDTQQSIEVSVEGSGEFNDCDDSDEQLNVTTDEQNVSI